MDDIRTERTTTPAPATTPPAKPQAEQLITAMSIAFVQTNASFDKPDPEQGAAALAHLQAMFLSAIPDHKARKFYRQAMKDLVSISMARMLAEKEKGNG